MFETELKLPAEWAAIEKIRILDADGWATREEWETPCTFAEYGRRRDESTLEMFVWSPDAYTPNPAG